MYLQEQVPEEEEESELTHQDGEEHPPKRARNDEGCTSTYEPTDTGDNGAQLSVSSSCGQHDGTQYEATRQAEEPTPSKRARRGDECIRTEGGSSYVAATIDDLLFKRITPSVV